MAAAAKARKSNGAKKSKGKASSKPHRRAAKPTKDKTVEVSTGVQLLLGNMPKDDDALRAYELLARLKAQAATASGNVSAQKKKMTEMGFDVKGFEDTMRLERMDPQEVANELKEKARLMRLRGLPVQMQLYEPKYKDADAQAFSEGRTLGKAGKSPDAQRWPEGTPSYDKHLEGWTAGQAELVGA